MAFFMSYLVVLILAIVVGSTRDVRSKGTLWVLSIIMPIAGLLYACCAAKNRLGEEQLSSRERQALHRVERDEAAEVLRAKAQEALRFRDAADNASWERHSNDRARAAESRKKNAWPR
jgi:hypothetical protein